MNELEKGLNATRDNLYPLTHAQKRVWYVDMMYENSCISNIACTCRFKEEVNFEILKKAINMSIYKNDGLRLRMVEIKDDVRQYVSEFKEIDFEAFDFSQDQDDRRLNDWLKVKAAQPFKLIDTELFEFALLKFSDKESGFFLKTHHIISDGWTYHILFQEISKIYEDLKAGKKIDLIKNPSYLEYIPQEEEYLHSPRFENDRKYWLDKLVPLPEESKINFGKQQSDSFKAECKTLAFSPEVRAKLHDFCKETNSSRFNVVMSALSIYISKVTGLERVSLSSVTHNRSNAMQKQMVGMFVGTFILLLDVPGDIDFRTLNENAKSELYNTLKKGSKYPFDILAEEIRKKTGTDPGYLFLNLNVVGHPDFVDDKIAYDYLFSGEDASSLGVNINIQNKDIKGILELTFNYRTDFFTQDEIAKIFNSIENILSICLDKPDMPISQVSLISEQERAIILGEFNDTRADFPYNTTINELFEKQVKKNPEKTALVYKGRKLTYGELNSRANQLARYLRKRGLKPDHTVAIMADRSIEVIIGMMAVLKAGGAYVPVDPEYPQERIRHLINDSASRWLISRNGLDKSIEFGGEIIDIGDERYFSGDARNLSRLNKPDNLMYVIYTSGSTGKPKGVMIEHRSVVNYINWHMNYYGINETYNCAAHGSFSFDASVPQIYSPLLSGAELHIIDAEIRLSPLELNEYFEKNNINHADLPTQFAEQFMMNVSNQSLKSITTGGEKLNYYKLQNYKLVDEYGPTEYTVTTTYFNIDKQYDKTPIGRPINNTRIYILDHNNDLQPIGIPGELCIAGAGIARGYLGRPELTEEKFVPDPFFPDEKMYKTGDLARWLPDGNIDFIGRKDFQVKIRGFRVELGEIETALRQNSGIRDAVVISSKNENGNDFLSAHVVLDNNIQVNGETYRIVTVAQDPSLVERMEIEHAGAWADFSVADKLNVKYWRKIYEAFPDYQFALLDDDNEMIALGNNVPLYWDGSEENLPPGWDGGLVRSLENREQGIKPNTLCALAVVVSKKIKGGALSYEVVKIMNKLVLATGLEHMILPVRPSLKEEYPHTDFKEFVHKKREDGLPFDPWVRVNIRLGGEIAGYCLQSQCFEGTIEQWEEWAGQKFEHSGDYVVKGAANLVKIDIENNKGTYYDKIVWIKQFPEQHAYPPVNTLNIESLRKYLSLHLPDYMIPAKLNFIKEIPLTVNGKVDKNALLAALSFEEHKTDYVAPRTEKEQILADIWKSILRLDRVGINDNFFNLGGDSIMGIQIVSRAREAGLGLLVKQLYVHPTIAELAAVAAEAEQIHVEQGIVTGEAPFTPIQNWFFERDFNKPNHFNQAFLLKFKNEVQFKYIEKAFELLNRHHDALRLRFHLDGTGGKKQYFSDDARQLSISRFNLNALPEIEQDKYISECCTQIQGALDIENGPNVALGYFEGHSDGHSRLLIAIHHLVIDMVSWRIILEDFQDIYLSLAQNKDVKLPQKTSSFKDWGQALVKYSNSDIINSEWDYWINAGKNSSLLPYDKEADSFKIGDTKNYAVSLDSEETSMLLGKVPDVYHTRINDILLSALALAAFQWTGKKDLLLDLEGHGREDCIAGVEISRTVGWFTSIYPVHLLLPDMPQDKINDSFISQTIKNVKEQLRAIPNNGIGYGILNYSARDERVKLLRENLPPQISFNYLGQLDSSLNETKLFTQAEENAGLFVSPENQGIHPIEIDGYVANDKLEMIFNYSLNLFDEATIVQFADAFKENLNRIIVHCQQLESGGYTPSDFSLVKLSQPDVDRFTSGKKIESIYELSPLQEGLLFHALLAPDSNQYVTQTHWTMEGRLDENAFKQSWQELIDYHAVFRTSFAWEGLEKPVQIVHERVEVPWNYVDLRKYSKAEQETRFESILKDDNRLVFDLHQPCLLRFYLVRMGDNSYRFVWTDHHILTDGWCVALLLEEVMKRYYGKVNDIKLDFPDPAPYSNYISWIKKQDRNGAKGFWEEHLQGIEEPTRLNCNKKNTILDIHKPIDNLQETIVSMDEKYTEELTSFTQNHHITINALVQSAWAAVLSLCSGERDVLLGTIVSGRPEQLRDVERMIGLFINSLPLKISIEDQKNAVEQIKDLQNNIQQINSYGYLSLNEIQEYSSVHSGLPLFYSLFVFENYPYDESAINKQILKITDIKVNEKTNLPLSLIVFPGKSLTFRVSYDGDVFEADSVLGLLDDLQYIIKWIMKNPEKTVSQVIDQMFSERYLKINPALPETHYPVSAAQRKTYLINTKEDAATINNLPYTITIEGSLDAAKLSKAIDVIIERHEILRTSFELVDGIPVQKVQERIKLKRSFEECSEDDIHDKTSSFVAPFNLALAPLFRIKLIKTSNTKHYLLMDFHRMIFDKYSVDLFVNELFSIYQGKQASNPDIQYKDYASWQDLSLSTAMFNKDKRYWMSRCSGEIPVLDLFSDRVNNNAAVFAGGCYNFSFDTETCEYLRALRISEDADIPVIFTVALNILLYEYTNQDDIIIGLSTDGRNKYSDSILGAFENILPLRNYLANDNPISQFIYEVKQNVNDAFSNRNYPIDALYELLNLKRNVERDPLFDVVVSWDGQNDAYSVPGIKVKTEPIDTGFSRYYMSMKLAEKDNGIELSINYRKKLYSEETVMRMTKHLANIIKEMVLDRNKKIKDIDYIAEPEKKQLLFAFNDTSKDYNVQRTVQELFEEQVERTPDKAAVVFNDKRLSYRELNEKGNKLAALLREKGVRSDTLVGILVEPSIEMMVGIFGVLKSGGAYVPIDSSYPPERIEYILQDSRASILLTQKHLADTSEFKGTVINIDDESLFELSIAGNISNINKPSDLVYVIYTSGSTGKPKGSMIEHHSLVNLSLWAQEYLNLTPEDNTAKYLSFGFDASVIEIFPPLVSGAALHIIDKDMRLSINELNEYFNRNNITAATFPTQFGEQFMEFADNKSLKWIMMGGEELRTVPDRNYSVINAYGPTEYTVCTTTCRVDKKFEKIPIGKPLYNSSVYIIDDFGNLKPCGAPGELCISGEGISRGYINRPELTSEKFVENPFTRGHKMYKTGDIARWLPDGNIEFMGRKDGQVKLRGFRIELGEIEQVLLMVDGITDAAVIARTDANNNKYLCGYYIGEHDAEELKQKIAKELPDYMVPAHLIRLDELPMTPNGKVDRKALPEPLTELNAGQAHTAAATRKEKDILEIWKSVLGVENIGVHDNFFQLGGHSLKAVTVTALLQENYDIKVSDIFKYQTIAELAKNINESKDNLKAKLKRMKDYFANRKENPQQLLQHKAEQEQYEEKNRRFVDIDLSKQKEYENILLAGSTGYRGVYLLHELLLQKKSHLYLPIRGASYIEAENKLIDRLDGYFGNGTYEKFKERISILNGDLTMEYLGLHPDIYRELSQKINCIFQCTAYLKHYGSRDDYYNGNVKTTQSLLELAKTGKTKDFNHLSTLSVLENHNKGKMKALVTEYDFELDELIDSLYVKTRFEAEKLVRDARQEGLVANIYRLGLVTLDYSSGTLQQNIEDTVFYQKTRAFLNISAVPEMLDEDPLTFVDYAAKAVVLLFDKTALMNETYHIINNGYTALSKVLSDAGLNLNIDKMDINTFIDYIDRNHKSEYMKEHIELLLLHLGILSEIPVDEYFENLPEIVMGKTNLILSRLGFKWPEFEAKKMHELIVKSLFGRIEFLKTVPLFSSLTPEAIKDLSMIAKAATYPDETDVIFQNETNENLYIIQDGNVEISRLAKSGWQGTIGVLGGGDFFGEDNIIGNNTASVTAESLFGDIQILSFRRDDIIEFIKNHPELGFGFLQQLSGKINKLIKLVVDYS
ncbi:MAG: amino acid adenylation domain-containing protein [Syntrophomonas sp.]